MNITKTKMNMIFVVLVSLAVVFSFGIGAVSADPSIIYVNDTSGNDAWNGEAPVWDGLTLLGPKKSIKNATGIVTTGGTVNVADGQYTGVNNTNIAITRNMNIKGQSQSGTIINANGTSLTRMFTISSGASVTISNLTFVNGNSTSGGAIYISGTTTVRSYLTVNNCAFISNKATDGGAISNIRSTLTVNNCSFINNFASSDGGAIMIESGTQAVYYVYNSTFIGNSANSYGGAIEQWGGYIFNY